MIEIKNISKSYDDVRALNNISMTIPDACVFGMLGTNGAGKSTLFRIMTGVQRQNEGEIRVDGEDVWENENAKGQMFYISDDQFYYANATPKDLAETYSTYYPDFDKKKFKELLERFSLQPGRKVQNFSKGMKKQVSILLGICSGAKYLLCDETFDGLDPVMRKGIKSIFANEICERKMTIVIASHNLRELEDICDYVGILHRGGVILDREVDELKGDLHKIQCVVDEDAAEKMKEELDIISYESKGRLITMTVRAKKDELYAYLDSLNPAFYEALPLSLEEIFINETGGVGYDVKNLIS